MYVIVGSALIIAAVWLVPQWIVVGDAGETVKGAPSLTTAERLEAITTTRQLMLFAAGGLLAIVGIVFTWRRDRTTRALADLERDANFTTRYTEAIAQLGDEKNLAIRLGGIYALERIAADSTRDRQTILSVLAAYLRTQSITQAASRHRVDVDTEAAAAVLNRITQMTGITYPTNLAGADLAGADLRRANLANADLNGASLVDADLTNAILYYADLRRADLTHADLTSAVLIFADLEGANLTAVDLSYANLNGVDLSDVNLSYSLLAFADLRDADLTGADLTGADLYYADLSATKLSEVKLEGVKVHDSTRWPAGFEVPS